LKIKKLFFICQLTKNMNKIFQNKFFLKTVQVALICLVVGGGLLGSSKNTKASCTATIDVVFYIDTSVSMDTEWTTVCGNITAIVKSIKAAGNTVNYKIYGLDVLRGCATAVIPVGSESWGPATSWVANNYPWTPSAIRIAVPMGDECPNTGNGSNCDQSDTNSINQAIVDANNNNVIVSPIISVGGAPHTLGANLANGTGGTISNASTPAAIVTAITDLITSEIGDKDGDGHLSVECGGDDCDDSEPSIYAGQPCFNKCFGDVLKGGVCQAVTGKCVYDNIITTCRELGDPCKLDGCVAVSGGDDVCSVDTGTNICGGLVPCGRLVNDPTTPYHENDDCTLCHLILMSQLIIEFLLRVATVVGAFFLVVAGLYYITAAGQPDKITMAKKIFEKVLVGFLIIFISWIIVDTILIMFGYIDPLGDGSWHMMC